ncbi:MAG: hypothetical protein JNJ71_20195 [Rubrivivax sp.]|nr:hypothetical protein [Rubrivivax sp.]
MSSSRLRTEVKPPSLQTAPESGWQRFMFWVLAPAPLDASPPLSRLPSVRTAFLGSVKDLVGDEAERLSRQIQRARSLRELWHLRAALFDVLARQLSQAEAQRRLLRLNPYFNARDTHSRFAPF